MKKITEEEKKMLIKVGILFLIIIMAALIYVFFIKHGQKGSDQYLIVDNYLILEKNNDKWNQIQEYNDELSKKTYNITDGINSYNNITMQYSQNRNWYFFDKDYNQIQMPKFRVATRNISVKLADYKKENVDNITDDVFINEVFNSYSVTNRETYRASKVTYDFDQDGIEETIYTLGNNTLESVDYVIRGFLFVVKNDKVTMLKQIKNGPFCVMEILDLDNDGKYEMIVSEKVLNMPTFDSCYLIYNLEGNKWNIKHECQKRK